MPPPADPLLLDDVEWLESADRHGALRTLAMAGAQVRRAATAVEEADLAPVAGDGRPRGFVVVARGGGATAADLLQVLAGVGCPIPLAHVDGPRIPGWVGPLDLVVVIDAEGASRHALAAVAEADRRGARIVTMAPAHSAVADACARARGSRVATDGIGVALPDRLAVWSYAVPLVAVAGAVGLGGHAQWPADRPDSELADVLDGVSTRCRPSSESFVNPAKALALDLAGSLPLLCALGDDAGVVVRRFVGQLAATAHYPALSAFLPGGSETMELLDGVFGADAGASSSAEGHSGPGRIAEFGQEDIFRDRGDDSEEARIRLVVVDGSPPSEEESAAPVEGEPDSAQVRTLAVERGIPVTDLSASGVLPGAVRPPLDRIAAMIVVADFAAAYLALAYGIAPTAGAEPGRGLADLGREMPPGRGFASGGLLGERPRTGPTVNGLP